MDLLLGACGFLGGLVVLPLLYLLMRSIDPGPFFYSQVRIGRYGRPFRIWKIRTMRTGADAALEDLLASSPVLMDQWAHKRKLHQDPRITKLGAWLRRVSLDEWPQFWNVLRGDLSLVGPRPLSLEEVQQYLGPHAVEILSLRPGLTCHWQLSGRSNLSFDDRIALDLRYIRTWTLWGDLRLMLRTVPQLLKAKGAC